jgi:hypothetical protein
LAWTHGSLPVIVDIAYYKQKACPLKRGSGSILSGLEQFSSVVSPFEGIAVRKNGEKDEWFRMVQIGRCRVGGIKLRILTKILQQERGIYSFFSRHCPSLR